MLFFYRNSACVAELVKDGMKVGNLVGGKLDGLPCHVNNPSKNGFDGRPGGITLLELLNGEKLFRVNTIGGSWGAEDFIDSMHQDASHHVLVMSVSLYNTDKIIHIRVNIV